MCNCALLPNAVAELEYWERRFHFEGAFEFGRHFELPEHEAFEPPLSHAETFYRCRECGQAWYVESVPEQMPSPSFALKIVSDKKPERDELQSAKEYLCVLAHGGFAEEKCRRVDCPNHSLKGRALCHVHISFP